ncbi:MAG: RDD family protein [Acidobacteria bacterium]|nr:RDD family protein [Acidobacteriota bacterium]
MMIRTAGWQRRMRTALIAIGLLVLGATGHAQAGRTGQTDRTEQTERTERYVYYGNTAVRVFQNYALAAGDGAREVIVAGGEATIDGEVSGDVHVFVGNVRVGPTAVIHGVLFVAGGDITIAEGASVRRGLAIIGGVIRAPVGFRPGGSQMVFGAERLRDSLRAIVPWFTHGLLWGRLVVPSIGWVWTVVFTMLALTLAINLVLHAPVRACAQALAARPFSAFMTGLLVLLLAGPLSALMAVSVVGIALVPFFLCALIVGWVVGKVGVARWIGDSVLPSESDSRLVGIRAVVIGFALITLLYMVPILGLVTWAMIGVFGIGAATQAFKGALRRERPAKVKSVLAPPAYEPPPAHEPPPAYEPAAAYAAPAAYAVPPVYDPPPPPPPPPAAMPTSATAFEASTAYSDLRGFPRATFVDRLSAAALDVALLVMVFSVFLRFGYRDDARVLFAFLYFVVFWAWKGTSLGGIICNLRLTRVDGAPLRFSDALVRGLTGIFSIGALGLGFLWILRDPERQAWHDRVAGTFVVKVPRDWPLP